MRVANFSSLLSFCFFLMLQQMTFALCASFLISFSYAISLPLAICAVLITAIYLRRTLAARADTNGFVTKRQFWPDSLPWLIFFGLFILYLAIRSQYSGINFINSPDEVGVEKLFNLSMQQSFLFGTTYPPEWVWLAGEPSRYYILLKTVPGLASWVARVLFGLAGTGGIFCILSEAFFVALFPAVLCAWILWFGRTCKNQSALVAAASLLPLFCFLGAHYHAISLGLAAFFSHSGLDWWNLSREVVPFTDDQYPVWLMILGDNHAYLQVYFLQALFWGAFLCVLFLDRYSFLLSAALGLLAAAVTLSHQCSALIDMIVLGVFVVLLSANYIKTKQWQRFRLAGVHAATTIAVAAFFLAVLYETCGKIKYVFLDRAIVSPLVPFLNLNFSIILWFALLLLHPSIREPISQRFNNLSRSDKCIVVITAALAMICYLSARPALTVMLVLGAATFFIFMRKDVSGFERMMCLFAVSSFSIWFLPEIVAFDHTLDTRTDWIRFQIAIRFWPEGYIMIPFALTLAAIERIGNTKSSLVWVLGTGAVVVLLFLSHIPGFANRVSRDSQRTISIDGFKEFARRYPDDNEIVSFLRTLPSTHKVVIAEACGVGDERVPVHFDWPGRIAAFSGRSGICGWIRHGMLYAGNEIHQVGFQGTSVYERGMAYLKSYLGFFSHVVNNESELAKLDLMELKSLGVTHIVFGQFEQKLVPLFSIDRTPNNLPLTIAFRSQNGLGVLEVNR